MRGTSAPIILALLLCAPPILAASPQPIKLTYVEGDYGGPTTIWSEDGKRVLGFIEYRQHRKGKRLHIERVARFRDGSSDEDVADVEVGERLHAISGRSIIRDRRGKPVVDLRIDVPKKRLSGFYVDEDGRHDVDEEADIGPGTYWGPLFSLVLKNFAANAVDAKVVVQSVASTPKPRVVDMEFKRDGSVSLRRTGGTIKTDRITLLPTVNFLVDPLLRKFVPLTEFFVAPGEPPTLARFSGPRNYAGQTIRIE
jgi:hypothetical protein